jgi:hypothetical protein
MTSDWGHDSSQLIDLLESQTYLMDNGRYKNIQFVDSGSTDFSIVFNFSFDSITTDPERTIGLVLEPKEILDSMYQGWRDFDLSKVGHYCSFTPLEGYELAFGVGFATAPIDFEYSSHPRKKACMIVSNKTYTEFQIKRREIFAGLLKTDFDIDFYGRGMSLSNDSRIKGEIPPYEKHLVIDNYDIVIDFENDPNAVTDKFFDPIICGATPITNNRSLKNVIGPEGFYSVDFNEDPSDILSQIASLIKLGRQDSTHLRQHVLNGKLSLAEWIFHKVNKIESTNPR